LDKSPQRIRKQRGGHTVYATSPTSFGFGGFVTGAK
jgi:hypothetical protein